jgi:hypothetical protein
MMRHTSLDRPAGWGDFVPAAALLAVGLGGLLGAYLWGGPGTGEYLVVAAPWSGQGGTIAAVRRADGALVRAGGFGMMVVASPRADFARRLRAAGAWLVVPTPFAAGCLGGNAEIG